MKILRGAQGSVCLQVSRAKNEMTQDEIDSLQKTVCSISIGCLMTRTFKKLEDTVSLFYHVSNLDEVAFHRNLIFLKTKFIVDGRDKSDIYLYIMFHFFFTVNSGTTLAANNRAIVKPKDSHSQCFAATHV